MSLSSTNTTPVGHAGQWNCLQKIGNFLQAPTHSLVRKRDKQKDCFVKALLAVLIAVTSPLALVGITFFKLGTSCSSFLAGSSLKGLPEQVLEQLSKYMEASRRFFKKPSPTDELDAMADALASLMDKLPKALPQTMSSTDIEIATNLLGGASISRKNYERLADSWNLADKLRAHKDFFEKVERAVVQSFSGGFEGYLEERLRFINKWLALKNLPRMDAQKVTRARRQPLCRWTSGGREPWCEESG